jgi:Uncharacterized conserved protein
MSLQLRIILIIMLIITTVVMIGQIKKRNLELQYTLSWLLLLFIILLVAIFPGILNWISGLFGIELPINMIFFLGFVFTLLIVYRLTEAASKMSREITELTQKIALLDKKNKNKDDGVE